MTFTHSATTVGQSVADEGRSFLQPVPIKLFTTYTRNYDIQCFALIVRLRAHGLSRMRASYARVRERAWSGANLSGRVGGGRAGQTRRLNESALLTASRNGQSGRVSVRAIRRPGGRAGGHAGRWMGRRAGGLANGEINSVLL